ncbi:hypothetical protein AGMMS49992_14350 [Clostridia bacterium]|nr:hypothetical protein AGMMS49992_14350 [Clostridia bacterium]
MNAQGRSQRPGTNASREANTARSALSMRDGQFEAPFIRFGRAEEAAQEAQKLEAARRAVERQAQLNAYDAETARMRQASAVPVGSAIPNSGQGLRTATGEEYPAYGGASSISESTARASTSAARVTSPQHYPTPYANGVARGVSAAQPNPHMPNQQRLNRTASTSAALRPRDPVQRAKPRRRRQRFALLFFSLILIAVALIRTLVFGAAIESGIRQNLQSTEALAQFLMDNHVELMGVTQGSAWAELRLFIIALCVGFTLNVFAWHQSNRPNKPLAVLTTLCYVLAIFTAPYRNFAPTICLTILPSLMFSAVSLYGIMMTPVRKAVGSPNKSRAKRAPPRRNTQSNSTRFL